MTFFWQFPGSGWPAQPLRPSADPGPVLQPPEESAPCPAEVFVGHSSSREPNTLSGQKRHSLPLEPESTGSVS